MADTNLSSHALLTMMNRCLSGHWLIEPEWLFHHADLVIRADKGEDLSSKWPRMAATLFAASDGSFVSAEKGAAPIGKGQTIGVINITGPIYKYGWNSSKTLVSMLRQLASDDRVGGVKLVMDSPGGMVHGTREVFQLITSFPKVILAEIDGYAASAGYYQIAGASRIVATQPNDLIGSIGTYRTVADYTAYYEKMGLPIYEVYARASTEKNEDYRQIIDSKGKERALAQQQIDAFNDLFIADVKSARGDRLTGKGQDPLKGRLFQPTEAIENGLIDEMVSDKDSFALLADMIATSKQSSIQMDLKSFFSQLGSLVSSAQKELGNEGSEQQQSGSQPTIEQLQQQLQSANQQIGTLTTERDSATQQVTSLTTERDGLKAKVDEYGEQPGAMGTKNQKEKDEQESGSADDWFAKVSSLEHNKEADAMFGK